MPDCSQVASCSRLAYLACELGLKPLQAAQRWLAPRLLLQPLPLGRHRRALCRAVGPDRRVGEEEAIAEGAQVGSQHNRSNPSRHASLPMHEQPRLSPSSSFLCYISAAVDYNAAKWY